MRRRHAQAAGVEMPLEEIAQQGDSVHIQRGQRLVEYPERPRDEPESREPDSASLSLRKHADRKSSLPAERDPIECLHHLTLRQGRVV